MTEASYRMDHRLRWLREILRYEGLHALPGELPRFIGRRIRAVIAWARGSYAVYLDQAAAHFEIQSYGEALNWIRTYQTEAPCLRRLMSRLRHTDVFWDIGAYHGLYAIFAAQVCQAVIAFEPYPPNARRIAVNCRLNRCEDRIRILELALSDRKGIASLDLRGGERAFMMGHVVPASERLGLILTAPGDTLPHHGIPPPDVVKIDVEGHECEVLAGMRELLRQHVRWLICEVHASALASCGQLGCVERILGELGFRTRRVHTRRTEYFLEAEKDAGPVGP